MAGDRRGGRSRPRAAASRFWFIVREPSQSSSMCTWTPRRAAFESSSTKVAPTPSRNTKVSNVMLVCAARMALSIAA